MQLDQKDKLNQFPFYFILFETNGVVFNSPWNIFAICSFKKKHDWNRHMLCNARRVYFVHDPFPPNPSHVGSGTERLITTCGNVWNVQTCHSFPAPLFCFSFNRLPNPRSPIFLFFVNTLLKSPWISSVSRAHFAIHFWTSNHFFIKINSGKSDTTSLPSAMTVNTTTNVVYPPYSRTAILRQFRPFRFPPPFFSDQSRLLLFSYLRKKLVVLAVFSIYCYYIVG